MIKFTLLYLIFSLFFNLASANAVSKEFEQYKDYFRDMVIVNEEGVLRPDKNVAVIEKNINDYAKILTPSMINLLEEKIVNFKAENAVQIIIVTLASLNGNNIEEYTKKVFYNGGIAQKSLYNGVWLLYAPNERAINIIAGKALQNKMTAETNNKVIKEMVPYLMKNDFDTGILKGLEAIIQQLKLHK